MRIAARTMLWFLALMSVGAAVPAHHSAAAYDVAHPLIVSGTVQNFAWASPHSQLALLVPRATGGTDEWQIESAAPSLLSRYGWTRDTLVPGQAIQVLIAPLRDGSHGGDLLSVRFADGRILHRCDCERVREVLKLKSF